MSKRLQWICFLGFVVTAAAGVTVLFLWGENLQRQYKTVIVGSKVFPESILLGEIVAGLARDAGADAVRHLPHAGGTGVLWHALVSGQIDVYVEYTGTILREIYSSNDLETVKEHLHEARLHLSGDLGFNNSYALAVGSGLAGRLDRLEISALRDLEAKDRQDLTFGLSSEFVTRRQDGFGDLSETYELPEFKIIKMSHDDVYDALQCGIVDAIDVYTTDAEIEVLQQAGKLRLLDDDLEFFPSYKALLFFRDDLAFKAPRVVERLGDLVGQIDDDAMRKLNAGYLIRDDPDCGEVAERVLAGELPTQTRPPLRDLPVETGDATHRFAEDVRRWEESRLDQSDPRRYLIDDARVRGMNADPEKLRQVARDFLANPAFDIAAEASTDPNYYERKNLWRNTKDHLSLVGLALTPAIFLGLWLGGIAARHRIAGGSLVILITAIWLIPPPAALGLMRYLGLTYEWLGTGAVPALLVIFLLTLYPVTIQAQQAFTAGADGDPRERRLALLDGVYNATLFAVGVAILGTLVDAGGYGGPIRAAIQLRDPSLAPLGAVPAIVLAAVVCALYWLLRLALRGRVRRRRPGAVSS